MKRFVVPLFALFALAAPAAAQVAPGVPAVFKWKPMWMRNTTAASTIARDANWLKGSPGAPTNSAYTDSTVFRRGVTTATVYDTTCGYDVRSLSSFGPQFGLTLSNALVDTTSVPWLVVRVRQDTTAYGATTITSGMDSVRVGAEYSTDGINWFSCSGTNTYRFDTVFFTSGADGLQSPSLIGVEGSPGEDGAQVVLRCHPSQATVNAFIINRTLCMTGGYVRFLIGGDYSGQFVVEAATWDRE